MNKRAQQMAAKEPLEKDNMRTLGNWVNESPTAGRLKAIKALALAKKQEQEKLASGQYEYRDTFKGRILVKK